MHLCSSVLCCLSRSPTWDFLHQMLSTRVDMLPAAFTDELSKLQAAVPPFSSQEARGVLEEAFGCPVDAVFEWLSQEPVASASLGQVGEHDGGVGCSLRCALQAAKVGTLLASTCA